MKSDLDIEFDDDRQVNDKNLKTKRDDRRVTARN